MDDQQGLEQGKSETPNPDTPGCCVMLPILAPY